LNILNARPSLKERDLSTSDFSFQAQNPSLAYDNQCIDAPLSRDYLTKRTTAAGGRILRRQSTSTPQTPGYTTTDDFGKDGDDTPHSTIPSYRQPSVIQANASFPADGSTPTAVDLVFLDFIAPNVVSALNSVGAKYSASDVAYYLPRLFTTNSYLPAYAKLKWQKGMPSCPVGGGF